MLFDTIIIGDEYEKICNIYNNPYSSIISSNI